MEIMGGPDKQGHDHQWASVGMTPVQAPSTLI